MVSRAVEGQRDWQKVSRLVRNVMLIAIVTAQLCELFLLGRLSTDVLRARALTDRAIQTVRILTLELENCQNADIASVSCSSLRSREEEQEVSHVR